MSRPRLERGLVQVYTGTGKGKTTAALGLGLRAAGHGFHVFLLQFMKGDPDYGELKALAHQPHVTFRQCGLPTFVERGQPSPEDLRLAAEGMRLAREILEAGDHDVVILDEINVAVDFGLVPEEEVLDLVRSRPTHVELVLTGRYAPPGILAAADLVSEMRSLRHPFQKGIPARRGIEH